MVNDGRPYDMNESVSERATDELPQLTCGICDEPLVLHGENRNTCEIPLASSSHDTIYMVFCRRCIALAAEDRPLPNGEPVVESTGQECDACAARPTDRRLLLPGQRSVPVCVPCLREALQK